ncbi:MAG: glutamate-1-semialdehyde 2,1-aminomutase [Planctomycetaceae bacterium]|nr:MAG: glutamate-1-semialdehyde 2,1-aminomutase [Planctomycetaceae bacterium]
MRFERSRDLQSRAARVIPSGSHCHAKGASEYPQASPGFIVRGSGCHVWDLDGNEFIEFASGNRSVTLGHAFPAVLNAVKGELDQGVNFSRPTPIETAAAEALLELVPASDMVKFCKNGSDATTAALRLARAATGRDHIAYCRDQPFFSSDDWFIATTPMSAGIPRSVAELTLPFGYNRPAELARLFAELPDRIAAVILEPARQEEPQDDFLGQVRRLCDAHGAVMILDEMITGFRWDLGGGQAVYGVRPDLSCWGKGLANGFSVSALSGIRSLMELGGPPDGVPEVFLLSTTHGAEPHSLAAAIATIDCYREQPVIETLYARGRRLREGCQAAIRQLGIESAFQLVGRDCCLNYVTRDSAGQPSAGFRALFLQETIRRGVLASSLVVNYSHAEADIDRAVEAIAGALAVYRDALESGYDRFLIGDVPKPIYRR